MKTLLVTSLRTKIEAKTSRDLIPAKLRGWRVEALSAGSLDQLKTIMAGLVRIQARAPRRAYVVFSVRDEGKNTGSANQSRQSRIHSVVAQINRDLAAFPNPDCVTLAFSLDPGALETQLEHPRAKLDLPWRHPEARAIEAAPRQSALDQAAEIVNATGDLRAGSGNLSAAAVATAFGVSVSQLAGWLGRTRQALGKTPDADSLQNALGFFERVARLRAVLPNTRLLKWLRMRNVQLDHKAPLELMAGRERQVVADLVDDMLTGAPS